jgi:hypothetical protein
MSDSSRKLSARTARPATGDARSETRERFSRLRFAEAKKAPLRDIIAPPSRCSLYSMERIWISWSPTKTTSSTALPIKALATGET